tara:strand:+ start:735 stop:1766 length:1032 start_codon:yes stop_codon:yes gene_type:complete
LTKNKFYIDKDISLASTLDSQFYTSESIYQKSIKNIFQKSWQFITHKTTLKNNNIYPFNFLSDSINEPLVLSINNSNITCFSNVCTHRGHIINKKTCQLNKMTCDYHGRTFNLNGTIKGAPGFKGVKKFPTKKDNLKEFSTINWNDFIFASIDPKIDITNVLNDISIRLEKFPYEKIELRESLSKTYHLDAHWALYCENFLEGFHVSFVHKNLASQINTKTYKTELLDNGVLQYADSKNEEPYAYYYWIFPNIMLNFYDWGVSVNIVEPLSMNKTRIKFLTFAEPNKNLTKLIKELHQVELEDEEVVLNVQKGVSSKTYVKGRYSVNHEKGVHHFHQLLSKYI